MTKVFPVKVRILLLFLSVWSPFNGMAQGVRVHSNKKPVATIQGQNIYEEQLLPLIEGSLRQLRNQEYDLKSRALEKLLNQRLLQAEARKKRTTAEEVLREEADSKVREPTSSELEAYYQAHKGRFERPLEEMRLRLRVEIVKERVQRAREEFYERLRQQAGVTILLRPPRWEIDYDPARIRGNPRATVTIVEFSDFQCPFCQRAYSVVKELLSKYEGKVKLAYRDFPLRQAHPGSQRAAEAARCAGEQGKFWEYHDLLFSTSQEVHRAEWIENARTLKLDETLFETCLSSGKFKPQIEEDLQAGRNAGVTGTPAFFINGILISGAQPASAFEKVIEAELTSLVGKQAAD